MGTFYNPKIVSSGLIYYTDFSNHKSYPSFTSDQYNNNVMLQLQGETSTVKDTSKFARNIVPSGTVMSSMTNSRLGSGSIPISTNNYLNIPYDFTQTGDFTFESWIYPITLSSQSTLFQIGNEATNRVVFFVDSTGCLNYNVYGYSTKTLNNISTGNPVRTGVWNWVSFARSGVSIYGAVGINLQGSGIETSVFGNPAATIIGATPGGGGPFSGYIDEFRFTSGICRYISSTANYQNANLTNPLPFPNWANPVDISRKGSNATIVNNPVYSGGFLKFDGQTQYMQTNLLPNNPKMSLNLWFNSASFSTASAYACLLSDQIPGNPNFDIRKKSGASNILELSIKVSGALEILNDLATLDDNQWYNIQVTYDQSNIVGYVNGKKTLSYAATAPLDITTTGICVAQNPSFSGRNLACSVASLSVYNRALSTNEVLQNYNSLKGRFNLI